MRKHQREPERRGWRRRTQLQHDRHPQCRQRRRGADANQTGRYNVGLGADALGSVTANNANVAVGDAALQKATGARNIAIGRNAGLNLTAGSDNIYLGHPGVAGDAGRIRIGAAGAQKAAFVAGITGVSIPGPTRPVLINANGQLGTATASSARLKTDIHGLSATAQRVLALRPVSYRYKTAPLVGGATEPQYGLIAEQVAKQFPALVQRGVDGKPAGVYYDQLPVLLLAQVKHQQRRIDAQHRRIASLQAQNRHQQRQIDWLIRHARHR